MAVGDKRPLIEPDVWEAIAELAEEDDRSVTNYINRVLRAHALKKKVSS